MKNLLIFFGLIITSISMNAQESIDGLWNTGKENTTIEIKNVIGKIYSSDNLKATEGKILIKEIKKTGNSYKGKLHIIKKNRWVDAEFIPNGNFLSVTVSVGWQSKTVKWTKVK
jgi:beta-lactam-binding protein with PASTA domain